MSRTSPESAGLRFSPANDLAEVEGLTLLARSRRSQLLRRHVKMSTIARVKTAAVSPPPRERLADRLARLAKLRRIEDEQARTRALQPYKVSDALPLDKMGFIGLMLPPTQTSVAGLQEASPSAAQMKLPPAVQTVERTAADSDGSDDRNGRDMTGAGEIATLMREFQAEQPASRMLAVAQQPSALPLAAIVHDGSAVAGAAPAALPAGMAAIMQPASAATGVVIPDTLSEADPIRRLAGVLQAVGPVDEPQAPILRSAVEPTAVRAMPPRPQMLEPEPEPIPVPLPSRREVPPPRRSVQSGWPSFVTGFAVALAFGAGLYVYLVS